MMYWSPGVFPEVPSAAFSLVIASWYLCALMSSFASFSGLASAGLFLGPFSSAPRAGVAGVRATITATAAPRIRADTNLGGAFMVLFHVTFERVIGRIRPR